MSNNTTLAKHHFCITGGIGTGKSYVCRLMKEHYGIDIYDCDDAAKRLMTTSRYIITELKKLIGEEAYIDGKLNKAVVAQFLLASEKNKQAINNIVHPAVIRDFHNSEYTWMESAILYEAHLEDTVDAVIAVTAPREVRINRIIERDGITREKATEWMDKQMKQEIIAEQADFIINNDGQCLLLPQISDMLRHFSL